MHWIYKCWKLIYACGSYKNAYGSKTSANTNVPFLLDFVSGSHKKTPVKVALILLVETFCVVVCQFSQYLLEKNARNSHVTQKHKTQDESY